MNTRMLMTGTIAVLLVGGAALAQSQTQTQPGGMAPMTPGQTAGQPMQNGQTGSMSSSTTSQPYTSAPQSSQAETDSYAGSDMQRAGERG